MNLNRGIKELDAEKDCCQTPKSCLLCAGNSKVIQIVRRFSESDHGHFGCLRCGLSFDGNVSELIDVEITSETISAIKNDSEYRSLFVETSRINDSAGQVYTNFKWTDNDALKSGVVRHVIKPIEAFWPADRIPKILDLGCGNGFTSVELAKRFGATITAVDPSPEVLGIEERSGIKAIQGTLDSIKFAEGEFSVVIIIGNLMLHPNPHASLREAVRILEDDGLLILDFKNVNSTVRRTLRTLARWNAHRILPKSIVERAFLNMRFGFNKSIMRRICKELGLIELQCYSKPPRLLEYSNKHDLQRGVGGAVWRLTDAIDSLLDERAWVQMVLRKPGGPNKSGEFRQS